VLSRNQHCHHNAATHCHYATSKQKEQPPYEFLWLKSWWIAGWRLGWGRSSNDCGRCRTSVRKQRGNAGVFNGTGSLGQSLQACHEHRRDGTAHTTPDPQPLMPCIRQASGNRVCVRRPPLPFPLCASAALSNGTQITQRAGRQPARGGRADDDWRTGHHTADRKDERERQGAYTSLCPTVATRTVPVRSDRPLPTSAARGPFASHSFPLVAWPVRAVQTHFIPAHVALHDGSSHGPVVAFCLVVADGMAAGGLGCRPDAGIVARDRAAPRQSRTGSHDGITCVMRRACIQLTLGSCGFVCHSACVCVAGCRAVVFAKKKRNCWSSCGRSTRTCASMWIGRVNAARSIVDGH
jgi:hypothetical protein